MNKVLGEEMSPTHLVCHGNSVPVVRLRLHVGIFCSRAKLNFKLASIVLLWCMTMFYCVFMKQTDTTNISKPLIKLKIASYHNAPVAECSTFSIPNAESHKYLWIRTC